MTNINILDLFLKSILLVKIIMVSLIAFSVISWAIIMQRICIFNSAKYTDKSFEEKFWSGIDFFYLYKEIQIRRDSLRGLEQIFYVGFKEFSRWSSLNNHPSELIINGISRVMRISINRELEMLESHISFLSTTGSISPYIGLLGTVFGIIHAFFALSTGSQFTLQMVAPGISEALITTAMGLFSAIPAVMACNYFNERVNKLDQNYGNFMEELIAILNRQVFLGDIKIRG